MASEFLEEWCHEQIEKQLPSADPKMLREILLIFVVKSSSSHWLQDIVIYDYTLISYEFHKELIIPPIFMQKPYFCKVVNWESKIQIYPQKWVS